MQYKIWWLQSLVVSVVLLGLLVFCWRTMNHDMEQVENSVTSTIELSKTLNHYPKAEALIEIPTGIFIQSVKYYSSSEVNISGYIWQRFSKSLEFDAPKLMPKIGDVGFVLPEQVNTESDGLPREVYRKDQGDHWVIGWYVEATLRQSFIYDTYPFDHKTIWLKLWPRVFFSNVVLVPDFAAYDIAPNSKIFGLESDIVLAGC